MIEDPQHQVNTLRQKYRRCTNTYVFFARASARALAGALPFTLALTFACALPHNVTRGTKNISLSSRLSVYLSACPSEKNIRIYTHMPPRPLEALHVRKHIVKKRYR